MTNLYDTLGVCKEATAAQLKTAFRKLARETHPDRNTEPGAEARFKEINSAYEVLSDPKKRTLYDQHGEAGLQGGFDPNFTRHGGPRGGFDPRYSSADLDVDDLLGSLFGGTQRGPRGPADMRARLRIDFRTAALGGERELTFDNAQPLKIRIPPGVRDGGSLRLRGKAPGGGDLVLTLGVDPDPRFERKGDDLHTTAHVTLSEALLGGPIEVPTLQKPVRLQVPECSQNGLRLRVRGKGIARKGHAPGDLYVTLEVRLPEHLDAEARAAVGVLERAYSPRRQPQAA